jgi:demethylmenaquinone methyltransferase / 2-methoxy-6-polyprenyl-1,4-benzoquinol methylase
MTSEEMKTQDKTAFGFKTVPTAEKAGLVRDVFTSVAGKYDLMNDLMSLGVHRLWKRYFVAQTGVRPGHAVLDVAGGTGDITKLLAKRLGADDRLVLSDINEDMLNVGKKRLIDAGLCHIETVIANAEDLSFEDNTFDCITIAFGLRNVTDKAKALRSMYKCLKPGGRLMILEFSTVAVPLLDKIYQTYSFNLLPKIGKWIAGDEESYRYLAESIKVHPDQDTLTQMMTDAGFDEASYQNLSGGIVAIHKGTKF